ncbi:MAG: ribosome recycling factor [Gammaproteobacteria bacterium]
MINEIKQDAEQRMQKTMVALQNEFSRMRTGRAHSGLLENITVDYYGNESPLNQVASVTVSDARTLQISPWEKAMVTVIEKAIINSELGLNPVVTGQIIRVPVPPLTEERRKEMIKLVRSEAESGRVAVRNVRRDANTHYKELLKSKDISEDEEHRAQDAIQKLTDKFIAEIDKLLSAKETDLMQI